MRRPAHGACPFARSFDRNGPAAHICQLPGHSWGMGVIDVQKARGALLFERRVDWTVRDALLYNLSVGVGSDPLRADLRHLFLETGLCPLPSFATALPDFFDTEPPRIRYPGVDCDLLDTVLGVEELEIYRPLPPEGSALVSERILDVWDKGSGILIAKETLAHTLDGAEFWRSVMNIFVKGERAPGGDRGPSFKLDFPASEPETIIVERLLPQQALLYRLCGDWNPMHADPVAVREKGYAFPFLHGLGVFGVACRVVTEHVLAGDGTRIRAMRAKFVGPTRPGEEIIFRIWNVADGLMLKVDSKERKSPLVDDCLITLS